MKNMLFTIIVVVFIFIASQLAMKNYDLRFLQPNQTSVTIINKEIKPAGRHLFIAILEQHFILFQKQHKYNLHCM